MGLDIRLPIGLMFSIVGFLLAGFGLLGDKAIYQRALGINVNLWWGLVMLLFGLVMLYFGKRGMRDIKREDAEHEAGASPPSRR